MNLKKLFIFIVSFLCLISYPLYGAWVLQGDATVSGQTIILTPSAGDKAGAVWAEHKLDLSKDFDFTFQANFGSRNSDGADGIAFVFHQDPRGTSTSCDTTGGGEWIGCYGIMPAVAIEFDTYENAARNDPSADHIGVNLYPADGTGVPDHAGASPVQARRSSSNIETGNNYTIRVVWTASTKTLVVYFDGNQRLTMTRDIVAQIFGGDPLVHWGFTASTGSAYNQHSVLINPSLTVTKTGTPTQVNAGEDITYTITITNTGNATGIVGEIKDTLPSGLTYVNGSTTGLTTNNPSINGQVLTWEGCWCIQLGTSNRRTLTFKARAGETPGITYNSVVILGSFPEVGSGDTAPVTIHTPRLILEKSVDKTTAGSGEEIIYTIQYNNTGDRSAYNIIIMDSIPLYTSYVVGSLRGGAVGSTYMTATPLTDAQDGDIGHVSGSNVIFIIPSLSASNGGKVYFKVKVD